MMRNDQTETSSALIAQIRKLLGHQFNVRNDQQSFNEIDRNIREMVEFRGTNLWVLMFAIIIASIGLNVNSAAVIIGAMLISPLMGPIMGIGYGVAINDVDLIKKSFKSISFAVMISLFSATLYFLITPLSEARSELLARTTPTIWDVLIALFGGLAGILATTRKEKSNVVPGVAIATALMPPLCTAGYGLASGHLAFFFGAFYLFFINMVFIALATVLFITYLNPPHKQFVDASTERRVRNTIAGLVLITVLPSIYLAYNMVTDAAFNSRAQTFLRQELNFEKTLRSQEVINPQSRQIEVTLIGDPVPDTEIKDVEKRLKYYNLDQAKLVIHQSSNPQLDIASLKTSLLSDLYSASLKTSEERDKRIKELEVELAQNKASQPDTQSIAQELKTQYPQVVDMALMKTVLWKSEGNHSELILLAYLTSKQAISAPDKAKIIAWLKIRTRMDHVRLIATQS